MPHAYSDQLALIAWSPVIRRILRFRLNPQKSVLSSISCFCQGWQREGLAAPGHESTALKPAFEDTMSWIRSSVASARQIPHFAEATKGRVPTVFQEADKHKKENYFGGIEEN